MVEKGDFMHYSDLTVGKSSPLVSLARWWIKPVRKLKCSVIQLMFIHWRKRIGLLSSKFFNQFETVLQIVVNQAGYGIAPIALQRAEKYLNN